MQNEVTKKGPLLNSKGELIEVGYAKSLIKDYNRKDIKASKFKIKEWDYYLIYNDEYGIALTLDDNSYMGLISISIIDFKKQVEKTVSPMQWLTFGKRNFPPSSKIGDVSYTSKGKTMTFLNDGKTRVLKAKLDNYHNKETFECELTLTDEPIDSMVIITPFKEKKTAFYYNQKIVGFKVKGYFKLGDFIYHFDDSTRGILDWGRGVWTYKNTWYWGAGTRCINGHEVGFNIGYGFGDTSKATENVVFYDGILHKLEDVAFNIPKDLKGKCDYLKPWTFTSSDKRFEMNFTPVINRSAKTDVGIICSDQNQVFGYFNGQIILDDGKVIEIKDFLGFAEKVFNKW